MNEFGPDTVLIDEDPGSSSAALTLIAVACALLDRQIAAQAASFEAEGGFTERLYRVRSAAKKK